MTLLAVNRSTFYLQLLVAVSITETSISSDSFCFKRSFPVKIDCCSLVQGFQSAKILLTQDLFLQCGSPRVLISTSLRKSFTSVDYLIEVIMANVPQQLRMKRSVVFNYPSSKVVWLSPCCSVQ